ncbi:Neurochondrin [Hordeum vulgare]|nr:Neurochondrin [Hordeum vulgare]
MLTGTTTLKAIMCLLVLSIAVHSTTAAQCGCCDIPDDDSEQLNQKQIIASGYRRWADRFPGVRNVVHQHVSV